VRGPAAGAAGPRTDLLRRRAAAVARMNSSSSALIRRDSLPTEGPGRPGRSRWTGGSPPGQRPRRRPPAGQSPAPGCHWPTHDDRLPATRPTRSWTPDQIRGPSHIPPDARRVIAAGCRGYGGVSARTSSCWPRALAANITSPWSPQTARWSPSSETYQRGQAALSGIESV